MRFLTILVALPIMINLMSCSPDSEGTGTTEYVYQDSGLYGFNLLDLEREKYYGVDFSLAATAPEEGDLYVRITKISGDTWKISMGSLKNWIASSYDRYTKSQTFTIIEPDTAADCKLEIPLGVFQIEYFENNATSPTRVKRIEVN